MNDLALVLFLKRKEFRNRFVQFFGQHKLKLAVVFVASIIFWFGLYKFFYAGLDFIRTNAGAEIAVHNIIQQIFYIFFFALSVMLLISNAIISYSSFFRGKEVAWLFSSPIKAENIFLYKFLESMAFSSWALLFLATPMLIAFGQIFSQPVYFYLISFIFIAAFMVVPAIFGSLVALLLSNFSPRIERLKINPLVLILPVGLYLIWQMMQVRTANREGIQAVVEVLGWLNFTNNPFFPSFWVSKGILQLSYGNMKESILFLALIISNVFFLLCIVYVLSNALFTRGWFRGSWNRSNKKYGSLFLEEFISAILFFLPKKELRLIIIKDMKSFVRDPVQWSQFLIFFGILFIYFINLKSFGYEDKNLFFRNVVAQMNLLAICLTVATFSSRFIFPLISLEGRRFWVMGMFPIKRSQILLSKFFFSVVMLLIMSEGLILISSYMLDLPYYMTVSHVLTMFGVCLGISALAVGLGAIYPDFREDNPSKIVSGFGGTLNLILSLFFVTIVLFMQSMPVFTAHWWIGIFATQGIVILVSLVFTFVPLILGIRAMNRLEV